MPNQIFDVRPKHGERLVGNVATTRKRLAAMLTERPAQRVDQTLDQTCPPPDHPCHRSQTLAPQARG
ncbi:MAG TPA: hypothetical protein PK797_05065, partial [Burkholderiaceae bacterium]|nr:hypothetical protein [Burkholderiaceae bacterium]